MTGWSGGSQNRTWQRGARGPDSGRLGVAGDVAAILDDFRAVAAILDDFRAAHGWQPGMVWDPYGLSLCPRDCRARRQGRPHGTYAWPGDRP